MQQQNVKKLAQDWQWKQRGLQESVQPVRGRPTRRTITPMFDKLTEEQMESLADRRQPLPEGVTAEQLLRESFAVWLADNLIRQGRL